MNGFLAIRLSFKNMFFNVIVLILFFAFDSGVESAGLPETRSGKIFLPPREIKVEI